MNSLAILLVVLAIAVVYVGYVFMQRRHSKSTSSSSKVSVTERFSALLHRKDDADAKEDEPFRHNNKDDSDSDDDDSDSDDSSDSDDEYKPKKAKKAKKAKKDKKKKNADDDSEDDAAAVDTDDSEDDEDSDDDDDDVGCGTHSARKRVVDAFVSVVGRKPSPREICVYVQPDLLTASTADLRRAIQKDYAAPPASASKPSNKSNQSNNQEEPQPYSTTTALAVSSIRQEPDRSGSYKKSKSLLVQRADMLKRLDSISAEIDQFRQFIQMM